MSVLRQERPCRLLTLRAGIVWISAVFANVWRSPPHLTVVPVGEVFNVQKHIEKPVVRLSPSRKYFTLTDVTYEQTTAKPKKGKTEPTPKLNGGGSSSGDDGL